MTAKVLMVQGTGSSVGKSILVAALCRILRQDGWNVAPFKAQNMSLNSFVTRDGGEMGRAQVVQAEAACVDPSVDMNPILLKPEADNRSQVIVRGKPVNTQSAREYYSQKEHLWAIVCESLERLRAEYEVVVIEGAGSPAEINLRDMDMVNMAVACYCQAPVLLVADIDRGGVFASIVGTLELLELDERALIKTVVINKFRGDLSLLTPGLTWLEKKTGIPVAGVIPYYHDIQIAEEDSVPLEKRKQMKSDDSHLLDIAVIHLPHMANFDDFDPLEQENGVRLRYVEGKGSLGHPDLIILPGTKSTISDLQYIKRNGITDEIITLAQDDLPVIGICGGYQMLGELILDPQQVESKYAQVEGLRLLPITTSFFPEKWTHQVKGRVVQNDGLLRRALGLSITGYEIHMGQTVGNHMKPLFQIEERSRKSCFDLDGCHSIEGEVLGTYLHGLFHNKEVRRSILAELAARKGVNLRFGDDVCSKEEEYDKLASLMRNNLDMKLVYRIIGQDMKTV